MSFNQDVKNELQKNLAGGKKKKGDDAERREFLQRAFLDIGSITDPEKEYHLEFVTSNVEYLDMVKEAAAFYDIEAKHTTRKNRPVLYVKGSEAIADLLNVMGAHISLMNMENSIILKDMRNNLNRKVNCEAANIIKTVNAGNRQVEDIKFLKEQGLFGTLPSSLKDIAELRLLYPDMPLKDLGELLDPKVGKSGVNHRLRRISEIADSHR